MIIRDVLAQNCKQYVVTEGDTGEGSILRLFGALFVNTVSVCNQLAVHHQPITLLPHAELCLSLNAFLKSILPCVHFQYEWAQWELSASPVPHQCPDQPKHHSLLVSHRQKMARLFIVRFAVSQHQWFASLHQACREQSEPASTSQIAVKQLGLFSH